MKKAIIIIGITKHLNYFLPLKTLNQMSKSLIRPHLDYCDRSFTIFLKQPISRQSVEDSPSGLDITEISAITFFDRHDQFSNC